MVKKKAPESILESEISDWNRCFNCVFSETLRRVHYRCNLKWHVKKFSEKKQTSYRDPELRVNADDKCEHLIERPDCATEVKGKFVILYAPRNEGVRKFPMDDFKANYAPRLRLIQEKYGFPFLPRYKTGYGWTFSSSREYALLRNLLVHNGSYNATRTDKYTCEKCGSKAYYDEVEVHHILERTNGGSDTTANLTILCLICHEIETWKLLTSNEEISTELIWKKVISNGVKLWKKRLEKTVVNIKNFDDYVTYYKRYKDSPTGESVSNIYNEKYKEYKKLLEKLLVFERRCKRNIAFYEKYDKKTTKWKYKPPKKLKKPRVDLSKFTTIDKFFK